MASAGGRSPSSPPPERLTTTQRKQVEVEKMVEDIYQVLSGAPTHTQSLVLELWKENHVEFLMAGLQQLGPNYHVLDANRPWLCYWILHALALLEEVLDPDLEGRVIDFLSRCQDKNGGYGGGPGQLPHLATTYAAVNTLLTLGSEKAFSSINRDKLYKFLLRMKDSMGCFRMHDDGEMDVRACYTAISVASSLNILDSELVHNVGNYITSCQTYEGGIAGEPGSEAHGGYTFCGLAAMILIDEAHRLDLHSLVEWVAFRQGVECGFQGRTNKLVDGCYSFWQGGVLALMQRMMPIINRQSKALYTGEGSSDSWQTDTDLYLSSQGKFSDIGMSFLDKTSECGPLFHSIALQQYILLCCQTWEGGLRDKPGTHRDHYHSCYCLSGLSLCQYSWVKDTGGLPLPNAVLGPFSNLLEPVHPLFNIVLDRYIKAQEFFSKS